MMSMPTLILDCSSRIAVVHNGIIENYAELKRQLISRGHIFRSETDTEVVAHLIEEAYASEKDLLSAVQKVVPSADRLLCPAGHCHR